MSNVPVMWYDAPAGAWTEALPLGNGRLGAMVYSGISRERVSINEDTFWSGYPRETNNHGALAALPRARELALQGRYLEAQRLIEQRMEGELTQAYLPFCRLIIDQRGVDDARASAYRRQLDMNSAVCSGSFCCGGVRFGRECFVSRPAQALVYRFTADKPGAVSIDAFLGGQIEHSVEERGGMLLMRLRAPAAVEPSYVRSDMPVRYGRTREQMGMRACALLAAEAEGGCVRVENGHLLAEGADSVTLYLCAATSFNGFDKHPELEGRDELAAALADMAAVRETCYERLLAEHTADHAELFGRVDFYLDMPRGEALPTGARLAAFDPARGDPVLFEQIFAYGRYLMIASSRPGSQPTNLQGIWNDELRAPWSCNYTVNINTEMNYWPAESCNLSELHLPLVDLLERLRTTGGQTSRIHFGARGACAAHNTDIWALSNPVGRGRPNTVQHAFWPMSLGWMSRHAFEHYEYTLDRDFLSRRAMPILRDAARFFLDTLADDGEGRLIFTPATSPENMFIWEGQRCGVAKSSTMNDCIVRETLENFVSAARVLGVEDTDTAEARAALGKMPPMRVGRGGQLLEWDSEYEESEPDHRHVSHLYGLYPARLINRETPELMDACRRSLELRGDDGTGWSLGWKINLWARLGDGDRALALLSRQLRLTSENGIAMNHAGGTYLNLFDAHPPFQIDGNFGACAGIAEMFVRALEGGAELLPALPSAWRDGHMRGLRAPGGLTLDIDFEGGGLARAVITASADMEKPALLVYRGGRACVQMRRGGSVTLVPADFV